MLEVQIIVSSLLGSSIWIPEASLVWSDMLSNVVIDDSTICDERSVTKNPQHFEGYSAGGYDPLSVPLLSLLQESGYSSHKRA